MNKTEEKPNADKKPLNNSVKQPVNKAPLKNPQPNGNQNKGTLFQYFNCKSQKAWKYIWIIMILILIEYIYSELN